MSFVRNIMGLMVVALMAIQAPRAAASGNTPATPLPGVTVTAPKPAKSNPPLKPTQEIHDFVQHHAVTTRIGQLARWSDQVCPITLGLPADFNAFVTRRVRAVAAAVGAPVNGTDHCDANIAILFTPEPQKLLDSIRHKKPVLLGFHYPAQLKRLASFTHPIQSWYVTGTEGLGGIVEVPGSGGGLMLDDSCCGTPGGELGSNFTKRLKSEVLAVVIIADSNKVADHEIGAIADYVAFLALAQTSPPETCGLLPSVLDVMAARCEDRAKPDGLSDADVAYLKALYATNLENVLSIEQDNIADRMQRALGAK